MKLIQAKKEHVIQILEILTDASAFLREQGIDQWQGVGAPTEEEVRRNVADGTQYALTDAGKIVAVCTVVSDEPAYLQIDGRWLSLGNYLAVHRVAVERSSRGRGLTKVLYQEIEGLARSRGIKFLRVDTHRENKIMQRAFLSCGFTACGVVQYRADGAMERLAYEKEIK